MMDIKQREEEEDIVDGIVEDRQVRRNSQCLMSKHGNPLSGNKWRFFASHPSIAEQTPSRCLSLFPR